MEDAMLRVKSLSKRFGGLLAVASVSFEVPRGKVVSLVGPNGAGKTTLFNVISGVHAADGGEVFFDGKNVTGWPTNLLAQAGLARTFQNVRLFPMLNAIENVMVGRTCRTRSGVLDALLWNKRDRDDRRQAIENAEELP